MKKILVFGLKDMIGGIENSYLSYYNLLDKKKYQIDFITKDLSMAYSDIFKSNGSNIDHIPSLKKSIKKYNKKIDEVFGRKYDVFHFHLGHWAYISEILLLKYAKKYKVKKIILHSHTIQDKTENNFVNFSRKILKIINKKNIYKYANENLACSVSAGKFRFGKRSFKVLNNAFEIDKFKYKEKYREEVRKKLKINENEFVIGHVGRMCYQKNQEFLIEVFKQYHTINNNTKLILIGEGKDENKLRDKIKKLNLEKSVIIEKSDNPYKYYSAFDIFCFPSRYEGLGIVGVEAQVNGLPCLFTDAIPEEIKVNNNIKFLPLNQDEWVKELLNKKLKRVQKLNKRIEKYDINNNVKELEKIYGE